jgi:hypothetical protein
MVAVSGLRGHVVDREPAGRRTAAALTVIAVRSGNRKCE